MAKKKNAKQIREEQKNEKMQKIQAVMKAKKEKIMSEKMIYENKPVLISKKIGKKSLAKAAGSKSNLVIENIVFMTSYGKGNFAIPEYKVIPGEEAEPLNPKSLSAVKFSGKSNEKIEFKGRLTITSEKKGSSDSERLIVASDNPLHFHNMEEKPCRTAGADMLCLKDKLEQWYFSKNFNDNVHIQIIHLILDIEKILAVHINNIVFALDNVLHFDSPELDSDFIGAGGWRINESYDDFKNQADKYNKFKDYLKRKELLYFGATFYKGNKIREESDIYAILTMLSAIRQFSFHSDFSEEGKGGVVKGDFLYRLDEKLPDEFKNTLDMLWKEIIKDFDTNFLEKNNVNLHILCELYKKEKPEDIVNAYYDFLMRKSFKNMGFSITKLREYMLADENLCEFKKTEYDSVRDKLYKILDFILTYYYQKQPELQDIIVSSLRCCMNDEEKEKIYSNTAEELVYLLYEIFVKAGNEVNAKNIKNLNKESKYDDKIQNKISETEMSYFSELIYMLTLLIDGKEINDLLTTLINKFDNIIGFLDVLKQLDIDVKFKENYNFFSLENCIRIDQELRVINSVARMQKPSPKARHIMYRDALRILGMDDRSDNEIDEEIKRTMPPDENGKIIKGKTGFRNFIASNVIESSSFRYLVRYNNPHKTRALIKNLNVVKFALNSIPDTQIQRYFDVCKDRSNSHLSGKSAQINALANIITNIDYKIFEDVNQKVNVNARNKDAWKKRRYQAIVSLYLTVLHIITKNLVYVNSRYVMAFHSLEHNAYFYGVNKLKEDYRKLVRKLLDDENYKKYGYFKNPKWHTLVSQNLANSDKKVTNYFRNVVAHISVIRNINDYIGDVQKFNSYFELYHYILQKIIKNNCKYDAENAQTVSYLANLDKHNTYCKDFVKAYCVPFGYNTPRYKNLTINELFDRNNPLPEPKDE